MNLEQRAARLWPHNTTYQQAWIRMVNLLGDKWLLAKPTAKGTV